MNMLHNVKLGTIPPTIAECAFALIERLTIDELADEVNLERLRFDSNDRNLLK